MKKLPVFRRFFAVSSTFFLCVIATAFAQEENAKPDIKLQVRAERETAIYQKGETVSFQVKLLENDQTLAGKELWFVVRGDGNYEKKGTVTSADPAAVIEASLDYPGFLRCDVGWNDAPGGKISAVGGAGVDPLEITAKTLEPEDFDAFWNAKKEALAAMPMNPKLVPVDPEKVKNPKVEVFDVKVDCLGGKPMSGYLAKPVGAQAKSLPIVISYHGAGVRSANMPTWDADKNVLALDVNAHGIENGQADDFYKGLNEGELKGYPHAGKQDPETIYFIGMYLRLIRSLQFMKSLPEWDGKTIAVKGGSQGGGQALVAAGIDPDVTFCLAFVPAICYPTGDIEGNFGGWPGLLRGVQAEAADPKAVKAALYIDAANFAKRIKAESVLSTGFIDYVCSPTSVYVAYNNIKAPKQIFPTPETGHGIPPKTSEMGHRLLWEFIERQRIAKAE